MKIQSKALIKGVEIDNTIIDFEDFPLIALEFSAIDTGGGFKDQILDFSFSVPKAELSLAADQEHELQLRLMNPENKSKEIQFSCEASLKPNGAHELECNGRLLKPDMSKELVGFVLNLLR